LVIIQLSQNNLNTPSGSPQNLVAFTVDGQLTYSFAFVANALNVYANGVLFKNGTDYTEGTNNYTLATAITNETGSGSLVFATSPTFVTPILGTPTSGNLLNTTGYTTANLSGTITNAQLANSTISGVSLGSNLANLTAGTNVTFSSGTTYNGSTAITISASGGGSSSPSAYAYSWFISR
jgi:hypothetical protein